MLEKNKRKKERAERPLWSGYYERKTKTKKEKLESAIKKYKKKGLDE